MSIEGIGEAVTGGLLARAVEPPAGEAVAGHGTTCLNCGAALQGDYCHRCGQAAHVHRTLHAFFHDLLHGVLHFEGKIWRTLPMLALRPGALTRRYIAGERARFVSPVALFLFSVFLMFAVFSSIGTPFGSDSPTPTITQEDALRGIEQARAINAKELKEAEAALARLQAQGLPTAQQEAGIAQIRRETAMTEQGRRFANSLGGQAAREKDGKPDGSLNLQVGWPPLDHALKKASENPSLLLYKLQSNAYKFSWALIPISVPFLWLMLFWKRGYRLYDHTIFVTYSLAFMSLGAILLSLLRPLGISGGVAGLALVLVPPVHIYAQLKGAYGLSRFGALWRTVLLLIAALIASIAFVVLLLALGAFH